MPHVDTVSLACGSASGTRSEAPEINGVAHMLEHMAFKGTDSRSAKAIAEAIEDVGGPPERVHDARAHGVLRKVLTGDVPLAVDIVSDILQHSVFDEEELSRERTVVLQEIGQSTDTPDDIVFDHFQATAFPDQPLGRRCSARRRSSNGCRAATWSTTCATLRRAQNDRGSGRQHRPRPLRRPDRHRVRRAWRRRRPTGSTPLPIAAAPTTRSATSSRSIW